jgi:hypothetical protein
MFDTGNARQEKLREELATLRDEAIAKLECRGYDVRGRTILISVNSPGCVSTSIDPPCCLTMMS